MSDEIEGDAFDISWSTSEFDVLTCKSGRFTALATTIFDGIVNNEVSGDTRETLLRTLLLEQLEENDAAAALLAQVASINLADSMTTGS